MPSRLYKIGRLVSGALPQSRVIFYPPYHRVILHFALPLLNLTMAATLKKLINGDSAQERPSNLPSEPEFEQVRIPTGRAFRRPDLMVFRRLFTRLPPPSSPSSSRTQSTARRSRSPRSRSV